MSRAHLTELAERRAQLVTRIHLDRARVTLALLEIRAVVSPAPDPTRSSELRPTAAKILNFAVPLFGTTRVGRWLRIASYAMSAFRIARNWSSGR